MRPHVFPQRSFRSRPWATLLCVGLTLAVAVAGLSADDWPEWRGKGRLGVWSETGIVERFPDAGLPVAWRTPSMLDTPARPLPAVASSSPMPSRSSPSATRRSNACSRSTSRPARFSGRRNGRPTTAACSSSTRSDHAPRRPWTAIASTSSARWATCWPSTSATGRVLWEKDYVKDFNASVPTWGMAGAPLVDGDRLICLVGGEPDAKLIAFDKRTGKEVWRALSSDSEPGYNQPIIIEAGGVRQLILSIPRGSARSTRPPERCTGRSITACRWGSSSRRRYRAGPTCSSPRSTAGRACSGWTRTSRQRRCCGAEWANRIPA